MRTLSLTILAAAALALALPAAAQTPLPPPGGYAPADARQDRIEELQRQVTAATAENERLQYELLQANREIARLRAMVGELAGVNQSVSQGQPPAAGGGDQPMDGPAPAPQSGLNPAQQRATGTLGSLSESQLPAPAMPVREAGDDYSRARDLLNNGNLAEAEVAFTDFLSRHAEDAQPAMLADARYWLAFTLLARNNYADAAAHFVTYLQNNPRGPQAPEAQVRLGMALAGMGQTRQACGAFNQLPARYPNAPSRVRALAVREAHAASCPA